MESQIQYVSRKMKSSNSLCLILVKKYLIKLHLCVVIVIQRKQPMKSHSYNILNKMHFNLIAWFVQPCSTIPKTVEHEKDTHNLTNTTKKHTNGLSIRLDRYHLRTRIQFSNGLVLFKHNLLNSSFDDRKEFFPLKERMIKHIESTEKPVRNVPFNSTNELNKQLNFRNDLCIKGFKTVNNDEQLRKICSHLCTAIGVNVTMNDIGSIYQRHGNDIIVRFKVLDVKKKYSKTMGINEHG